MRAYNKNNPIYKEHSLKAVLEWLYEEARKNNRRSNLSRSDLSWSDLSWSNLSESNLSGSNFDFSVLNLSCKGIDLKFDDRVIRQLMNHALKQNNHCEVYEEIKQAFLDNPKWKNWLED